MPVSDEFFLRRRAGWSPATASSDFTTSFSVTENPISQGGIWVLGKDDGIAWNNVQTTPGLAFGSSLVGLGPSAYDDDLAQLKVSAAMVNADHYTLGRVFRASGYFPTGANHEIELLGRFAISANSAAGYECLFGLTPTQAYMAVVKWLGAAGSFTALWDPGVGSISPLITGDMVRVEYRGTNVRIYINGTKIGPAGPGNTGVGANDVDLTKSTGGSSLSTWDSGQPGLGMWPQSGSTLSSYGWSYFETGNL